MFENSLKLSMLFARLFHCCWSCSRPISTKALTKYMQLSLKLTIKANYVKKMKMVSLLPFYNSKDYYSGNPLLAVESLIRIAMFKQRSVRQVPLMVKKMLRATLSPQRLMAKTSGRMGNRNGMDSSPICCLLERKEI